MSTDQERNENMSETMAQRALHTRLRGQGIARVMTNYQDEGADKTITPESFDFDKLESICLSIREEGLKTITVQRGLLEDLLGQVAFLVNSDDCDEHTRSDQINELETVYRMVVGDI